jgi:hypothetical protein
MLGYGAQCSMMSRYKPSGLKLSIPVRVEISGDTYMSGTEQSLVKESEGRSYVTRAVLLLVNAPAATAQLVQGASELVVPRLLPIYRTGTSTLIGYGHLENTVQSVLTVRLFLDYSTPERLELETGAQKYLELVLSGEAPNLRLTNQRPDDERVLPVGAPELALY